MTRPATVPSSTRRTEPYPREPMRRRSSDSVRRPSCSAGSPIGADKDKFLSRWYEVNAIVHEIVYKFGGSISAEHGIGVIKRDLLPDVKDPVALQLMHGFKHMLDPNDILNPGKVI
jgi:FAD/FMN-containing dehydrogenase